MKVIARQGTHSHYLGNQTTIRQKILEIEDIYKLHYFFDVINGNDLVVNH